MTSNSNDIWFVLVGEQSYGPFTSDVMIGFVVEKRIVASSLMSLHPQQGYRPAADYPVFRQWLHAANPMPTQAAPNPAPTQHHRPTAAMTTQAPHPPVTEQDQQGKTVYIVMAEIDPKTGMNFLRKLQGFGHAQRIGDTVWLLQTDYNLADVKNTLAATLNKRDRLFIHDCFANQQSWENIGADLDHRIRNMWQTIRR